MSVKGQIAKDKFNFNVFSILVKFTWELSSSLLFLFFLFFFFCLFFFSIIAQSVNYCSILFAVTSVAR